MDRITMSAHEVMQQSAPLIESYTLHIRNFLDSQFGEGFTLAHPTFIGLLVLARTIECASSIKTAVHQDCDERLDNIAAAIEKLAEAIDSADSLYQIAAAIEETASKKSSV